MLFGQPWILWALFAGLIPVVIHLVNHWRHKTISWGAMAFLFSATRQIKGRKKIVHYLILTMRVLILLALVFALARPKLGGAFSFGSKMPDQVIVLVDRSLSMEHRNAAEALSLRERLLSQLKETMKAMPETRFFVIESAGNKIWEVENNDLLTDVSDLSATETSADIPQMMMKAVQYIEDNFTGISEIWAASDMQKLTWNPDSELWTSLGKVDRDKLGWSALRVLGVKGDYAQDDAIRVLSAQLRNKELVLSLELIQKGQGKNDVKRNVPLVLSINGGRVMESVLVQGRTTQFTKVISLPTKLEDGYGYVGLAPDENLLDNVAFFTFKDEQPLKLAALGEDGESLEAWMKMMAPRALGSRVMNRLKFQELAKSSLFGYGVILWQQALPTGEEAKALLDYVEKGGMVLFVPEGASPQGVVNSPVTFAEIGWGDLQDAPDNEEFEISSWEKEEGILRDDAEGQSIPVNQVKAIKRKSIVGDGFVLARWDDGSPALMRKSVGEGQIFFLGSLPDYTWSNLGDGALLVPMIQRVCQAARMRFSSGNSVDLASEAARLSLSKPRVREDNYAREKLVKQEEFSSGIFRVDSDLIAINRAWAEDSCDEVTIDSLRDKWETLPLYKLEGAGKVEVGDEGASLVREIWRWFIILSILCLLVEAWLTLPKSQQSVKSEGKGF